MVHVQKMNSMTNLLSRPPIFEMFLTKMLASVSHAIRFVVANEKAPT